MIFRLACGDVMPGCSARFENTDRSALMQEVAAHAAAAHGISPITPEIAEQVGRKVDIGV